MKNHPLLQPLLVALLISMAGGESRADQVRTSPVGKFVKVGTSSIQVIGANASRRGIIFVNPSDKRTITLVPANQTAVSGQGIRILPLGERWFIGDGKLVNYNSAWNAIADDGSETSLEVIELR